MTVTTNKDTFMLKVDIKCIHSDILQNVDEMTSKVIQTLLEMSILVMESFTIIKTIGEVSGKKLL